MEDVIDRELATRLGRLSRRYRLIFVLVRFIAVASDSKIIVWICF